MDFDKQDELRNKYTLIMRGFLTLRNMLEVHLQSKNTGGPLLDENDGNRRTVLDFIERVAAKARKLEIDALVAEFGPDTMQVLE
ncbi:MAG: hypothetical protein L0Y71_23165 [Gemmataceae bacterium]|nr:hypothetical protein [Gemmataceae bacterium]